MSQDRPSGSHDCGGDAAPFALGALDPAESQAFRRHLAQCTICRHELDAFVAAVQALPMAAPQHTAPRGLRRRVLKAIRTEPSVTGSPWLAFRLGPKPAFGVLGLLLAAALIVGGLEAASTPPNVPVRRAQVVGISGTAVLRLSEGRGELIARHLSRPSSGRVYEVWLRVRNRPPRPAGVLFSVSPNGSADVGLPVSLRGISQVMVTSEPVGGSPQPTRRPVIIAQVS
jgi:hypothetical protein